MARRRASAADAAHPISSNNKTPTGAASARRPARARKMPQDSNVYRLPYAADAVEVDRVALAQRNIVDVTSGLVSEALRKNVTGVFYVIQRPDGSFTAHASGEISRNFEWLSRVASKALQRLEAPVRERCALRLVGQ